MIQLQPLFPSAIGFESAPDLVTYDLVNDVKSLSQGQNTHNRVSIENRILTTDKNEFKTKHSQLVKFLEDSLENFYYHALGVPFEDGNIESVITQSWFTYSVKGESMHGHKHPNSIVSGVFYINAKNEDQIIFTKQHEYKNLEWYAKERNEYTGKEFIVPVKTGDLILFNSNQHHHFNDIEHDEERISLAFNSWLGGEFGTKDALTHLVSNNTY